MILRPPMEKPQRHDMGWVLGFRTGSSATHRLPLRHIPHTLMTHYTERLTTPIYIACRISAFTNYHFPLLHFERKYIFESDVQSNDRCPSRHIRHIFGSARCIFRPHSYSAVHLNTLLLWFHKYFHMLCFGRGWWIV